MLIHVKQEGGMSGSRVTGVIQESGIFHVKDKIIRVVQSGEVRVHVKEVAGWSGNTRKEVRVVTQVL